MSASIGPFVKQGGGRVRPAMPAQRPLPLSLGTVHMTETLFPRLSPYAMARFRPDAS